MTDRYHTLTVVLARDLRADDAKPLMDAITLLEGVLFVSGVVSDINSHMAEERARHEFGERLLKICYPPVKEKP